MTSNALDKIPDREPVPQTGLRQVHQDVVDRLTADLGQVTRGRGKAAVKHNRIDLLRERLDDITFNALLHWLSSARRSSLDTKRGYADDILRMADWLADHLGCYTVPLLHRLDYSTITTWTVYAKSDGPQPGGLAVRTQRRVLSAVSSLFNYAIKRGVHVVNPVDFEEHVQPVGTSTSGRPAGATRVLEMTDVAAVEAAAETPEEHLVFDLGVLQGLRESEIVKISVENIDRSASPYKLRFEGKRGKWYERELPPRTEQYLEAHIEGREEGPLLIDPKTGEAKNRHQIIDITRRLARRAGLANPATVTPHVLRASAITDLMGQGKPLQEVQRWARHGDPTTTQAYWERKNELRRDAALTTALVAGLAEAAAGINGQPEAEDRPQRREP